MKSGHGGKIYYAGVAILMVMLICVGQSLLDHTQSKNVKAADSQQQIDTLLKTEDELLEVLVPEDMENAILVTAEGNISDLLIPESEHTDEQKDNEDVDVESIPEKTVTLKEAPHILIYHTHTTEAYRQDGEDTYKETTEWRTNDQSKSIVQVGEVLKEKLEALGFVVIHDTTDHEPPKLATAYSRSLETMEEYKEKYPDMSFYIDLHRDAANVETAQDDVVEIDGKRCARLMFVVGMGEKYDEKPNWQENYSLAKSIMAKLNEFDENMTRPIRLKTGRYNQHVAENCILVEAGHNANTLKEAENSMEYLAQAIAKVVKPG